MRREEELFDSMKKLNNRLTLLEDCVRMLEQRVVVVEEMNRLNERKISKSLQELYAHGSDIKDLKAALNSFGAITSESSDTESKE